MALVDSVRRATPPPLVASNIPEGVAIFGGGPLLRLLRRAPRLSPLADMPGGRALMAVAAAWLPLLALSLYGGLAVSGSDLPFLEDVQIHARLLIGLPLLIIGAHHAHLVTTSALQEFVRRGIVVEKDREKFARILQAASRWNDSVVVRLAIAGIVLFFGPATWHHALASEPASAWYGGRGATTTLAGFWLSWIANPIIQYLQVLWVLRFALYATMLARVAALSLHLVATHPDQAGGIGFLGEKTDGFFAFVAAEGAVMAGVVANHILHAGRPLALFEIDIVVAAAVVVALVLGPMCVFIPALRETKRKGYREYGGLANRYVREFEQRWSTSRPAAEARELLGASDIQSLADMANAFQLVDHMRPVPFSNRAVILLLVLFLLPIAPLLLMVVPAEQMLNKLLGAFLG